MITFEAKAFARRAAVGSPMSARTWSMFVRPRVEVWKSIPRSQGATKFWKMTYPLLLGRDILEHYRVDVTRRADAEGPTAEE